MAQGLVSFQDRVQADYVFGTRVDKGATLTEAMSYVGLDTFGERQVPVFAEGIQIPNQQAIMGDVDGQTRVLGQHSNRYGFVPHMDAMGFVEVLTSESDLMVDAMGYYRGGSVAFTSLRMPDAVEIGGQDKVFTYLRVLSSYDGSTPLLYQAHAKRMGCQNEITGMLRNRSLPRLSVKHIGDPLGRIGVAAARNALSLTFSAQDEFAAMANQWADEAYTSEQLNGVLETLHPVVKDDSARVESRQMNAREAIVDALKSETNEGISESFWGLLNASLEVSQWKNPNKDDDKRATSVLNGGLVRNEQRIQSVISEVSGLQLI